MEPQEQSSAIRILARSTARSANGAHGAIVQQIAAAVYRQGHGLSLYRHSSEASLVRTLWRQGPVMSSPAVRTTGSSAHGAIVPLNAAGAFRPEPLSARIVTVMCFLTEVVTHQCRQHHKRATRNHVRSIASENGCLPVLATSNAAAVHNWRPL